MLFYELVRDLFSKERKARLTLGSRFDSKQVKCLRDVQRSRKELFLKGMLQVAAVPLGGTILAVCAFAGTSSWSTWLHWLVPAAIVLVAVPAPIMTLIGERTLWAADTETVLAAKVATYAPPEMLMIAEAILKDQPGALEFAQTIIKDQNFEGSLEELCVNALLL